MTSDAQSSLPPITVVSWAEFLVNPPVLYGLFQDRPGTVQYDTEQVFALVCDENTHSFSRQWVFYVHSGDDMSRLENNLMNKFILIQPTVVHLQTSTRDGGEKLSKWEVCVAVLINPHHPSIRQQMQKIVNRVRHMLNCEQKFSVHVDISEPLISWYQDALDVVPGCHTHYATRTQNGGFHVTNHVLESEFFDCSTAWSLCLPLCWLLSAPCYKIYRKLTCRDLEMKIRGDVGMVAQLNVIDSVL